MFVDADGIQPHFGGEFQLVYIFVIDLVAALRIEQAGIDIHPDRFVLVLEIIRQVRIGHQMEPEKFHESDLLDRQIIIQTGLGLHIECP